MPCRHVALPDGSAAIVCGPGKRCVVCRRAADRLCDWKVPERKSGTCDKPICYRCTVSPTPDKDLCPDHAASFDEWKKGRRR
jgi:hypothetical protein